MQIQGHREAAFSLQLAQTLMQYDDDKQLRQLITCRHQLRELLNDNRVADAEAVLSDFRALAKDPDLRSECARWAMRLDSRRSALG